MSADGRFLGVNQPERGRREWEHLSAAVVLVIYLFTAHEGRPMGHAWPTPGRRARRPAAKSALHSTFAAFDDGPRRERGRRQHAPLTPD